MTYKTFEDYRQAWDKAYTHDPDIPLNLDIELASACNAKCTFCLYGDQDWRKGMNEKDWDGYPKKRFMKIDTALKLIDEAAEIGIPAIKFNFRGESVLHPEYGRIVRHAAGMKVVYPSVDSIDDKGQITEVLVRGPAFQDLLANTNGNIPKMLWSSSIEGLMWCTKVMISLDSMDPEIYPKVRVGLSLQDVQATIDELVRQKHSNLWVRRVVCKDNKDEKFVEAVKNRWPSGVKVSEHFAYDRNHYQHQEIHGEDWTQWERVYCGYPSQRVVVEASGRYVPCCIAWEGELDSGMRWPETKILQYWNSGWRRQLAQELRSNIFSNAKCKNCTSYMAFKRPERQYVQDQEAVPK